MVKFSFTFSIIASVPLLLKQVWFHGEEDAQDQIFLVFTQRSQTIWTGYRKLWMESASASLYNCIQEERENEKEFLKYLLHFF